MAIDEKDYNPALTQDADLTVDGALNAAGTFEIGGTQVTATAGELNILDGVTATAAEINAAADVSARLVEITDAATYTVLAANSGKIHSIPDLSQDIVISLPTAAAGLEYTFISSGVAADTSDWQLDTGADANFYLGGVSVLDTTAGDEVGIFQPDGNSNSLFNILTPNAGTRVSVICDGTSWILDGVIVSATDPTFADQA